MDLTEAARRVLFHHVRLIVTFIVLGAVAGAAIAMMRPAEFTASARVMLPTQASESPEAVTAASDAARAVVTSRGFVADALEGVDASLDPADIARDAVRVDPLGTSPAIEIAVTHADPSVAADVANALSDELVRRWPGAAGPASDAVDVVEQRIDQIGRQVEELDGTIGRLSITIGQVGETPRGRLLRARRRALVTERDELTQLRLALETQATSLLVDRASQSEPQVIDRAAPPAAPDPNHTIPVAALGALLGAILGIAAA
ncbi:MAG TPA: Wzz/FepE/Etk N-terminal domain-containing protein, partial [Actinomycetota bacterium]|nr:Wzz/FepE/Etk N-terminal domain-containing protein [Actinomycetota bacterium]